MLRRHIQFWLLTALIAALLPLNVLDASNPRPCPPEAPRPSLSRRLSDGLTRWLGCADATGPRVAIAHAAAIAPQPFEYVAPVVAGPRSLVSLHVLALPPPR